MNLRNILRVLHRYPGYFIMGINFVYSLSGILLNHRHDFKPYYKITMTDFKRETRIKLWGWWLTITGFMIPLLLHSYMFKNNQKNLIK